MENRGLIFIPDISGFTRFVNETEIEHSRLIIQELLELLINSNEIGLQISEIEGDAILFYKFGEPPALDDLKVQVENMFCSFHKSLIAYENHKYCQCKACTSAIGLSLKIICHYGEFTRYQVKEFSKLIGKDIIVAHQLLKNDLKPHEYWLITASAIAANRSGLPESMEWNDKSIQTDSGKISYFYTLLTELKQKVASEGTTVQSFPQLRSVFSMAKEYDTDMITLFHATGDFTHRHRWRDGVKKVEEVNHFLPRVGMKCRCIRENGESYIYSYSYQYSETKIEFAEKEEGQDSLVRYILEKISPARTRFILDYQVSNSMMSRFVFNLFEKRSLEEHFSKSLNNLGIFLKDFHY
jgi:hypothetical protein